MTTTKHIEFALKAIPQFSDQVLESFANLPTDRYLQTAQPFRLRRFSKTRIENGSSVGIDDTDFFQVSEINHYAGGITRKYEPVETDVLTEFVQFYKDQIGPFFGGCDVEIGFHQIRITCGEDFVGYPVPEGWHKDGFDFIAMMCVSAFNVIGGISRVRDNLLRDHDFFSKVLQPLEMIVINDRRFHHFTDPINTAGEEDDGYRDMLVVTISILDGAKK